MKSHLTLIQIIIKHIRVNSFYVDISKQWFNVFITAVSFLAETVFFAKDKIFCFSKEKTFL